MIGDVEQTSTASGVSVSAARSRQTNKPVSPAGYAHRAYFSYPTYYAIGELVHGSLDEPSLKFGSRSSKR